MKGKKVIIHWTDPNYLEEFYRAWGSGQSTTVRQEQKKSKKNSDEPVASRRESRDDSEEV